VAFQRYSSISRAIYCVLGMLSRALRPPLDKPGRATYNPNGKL
jgi:hypothetical protein